MNEQKQMKAIFLDRDGVINKEKEYLHKSEDFDFIEGIFDACLAWESRGYRIIIVTNQSGIGRKYYSEEEYQELTQWMLDQFLEKGIHILKVYHCPHTPQASCLCRKPNPGMFLEAQNTYNINMSQSWMIGDKESDIVAATRAGISSTILVESGHAIDKTRTKASYVLPSIQEAIDIIR